MQQLQNKHGVRTEFTGIEQECKWCMYSVTKYGNFTTVFFTFVMPCVVTFQRVYF